MNNQAQTESIPAWANNCPQWVVEKAIKDFQFYKDLDIQTEAINIASCGLISLDKAVAVTVMSISYLTMTGGEWIDSNWNICLSDEAEAAIRKELAESRGETEIDWEERLDPFYLPGFTYQLNEEKNQIEWYYRAWQSVD